MIVTNCLTNTFPQRSYKQIPFREKALWTIVTLFIFLVCCQIPLYGVAASKSSDPFYWMRVILASNRYQKLTVKKIISRGRLFNLLNLKNYWSNMVIR